MTKLAIRGHATRGKEVIEILEMLGGWNIYKCVGDRKDLVYYITSDIYNSIENGKESNTNSYKSFSLEEFLEKFPYKVGDNVKYNNNIFCIKSSQWDSEKNTVIYYIDADWSEGYVVETNNLQPYKEETMENKNEKSVNHVYDAEIISFDIAQKDKYELDLRSSFEIKLRDGKYFVERIKPRYPKTYNGCCGTINVINTEIPHIILSQLGRPITSLAKLIVCRDAYWKIAGEELGLDEPWKPIWTDNQKKWIINFYQGKINFTSGPNVQFILAFPTEDMRDAFYENFKDLIEQCKELI